MLWSFLGGLRLYGAEGGRPSAILRGIFSGACAAADRCSGKMAAYGPMHKNMRYSGIVRVAVI